jgi:hypothetical protein
MPRIDGRMDGNAFSRLARTNRTLAGLLSRSRCFLFIAVLAKDAHPH